MPINVIINECKTKMEKAVSVLQEEFKGLRTGRASPALVENIKVEYYGVPTPMKAVASISAPQADLIVIKPFDAGALAGIEKAIKTSDLSIAPMIDGKLIRLNVPSLSEERRKQLVHQAKQSGEQTKVSIRNIRRDVIKQLEKAENDKVITEDDLEHGKKQVEDLTKKHVEKVEEVVKHKSNEIMQG